MFHRRALLTCVLLLALVSPGAMFAQDAETGFPVAVVALRGSFEPSGEGCALIWQNAGTPTLRVASSNGDRFRQDLLDGELMTLPDVDEDIACVFRIDVSISGNRTFAISIEGSELTTVSDDDLEALEATMVLPVELDRDEIVLATDDYLDLDIDIDQGSDTGTIPEPDATPGAPSTEPTVPGVLRKVTVEPVGQSATATIPVTILEGPGATPETAEEPDPGTGVVGGPVGDGQFQIAGQLDFWSSGVLVTERGCAGGPGNEDIGPGAQVVIRNETGTIIGYGTLEESSRSGDGHCSYDFTATVPGADFYVVELGDRGSVVYGHDELESTGWRMHLETGER